MEYATSWSRSYPLAELLNTMTATGFVLEEFAEGAEPTPVTLALRARKP